MRSTLGYFRGSLAFTGAGLALAAILGWRAHGTVAGAAGTVFVVAVLGVLETSISFDNAVVNATVLRDLSVVWRRRFLTWGIGIAVFGMRLVFPLGVVSAVAAIGPWDALRLALLEPAEYARTLASAHGVLGAFGGAFLGMVCLEFLLDPEKDVHWVPGVEPWLARLGRVEAIALGVMLTILWLVSRLVPTAEAHAFLVAGVFGLLTFIAVGGLAAWLELPPDRRPGAHGAGAATFLYLEVLDASFSFDGVIGAFALTHDLLVIAIGLGIGAMFVRSLTVLLVERGTLASLRYLEHGAFWAIGALAVLMLAGTVVRVPELVTGLVGAVLVGLALLSSLRERRATAASAGVSALVGSADPARAE